jgi:hypothetical protein
MLGAAWAVAGAMTAAPVVAAGGPCVTLGLRAQPGLNTAMVPEKISSTFINCSAVTETITGKQSIVGPYNTAADHSGSIVYTVTLMPGQMVTKVRWFPYACCGTYTVTLKAFSSSGAPLGHRTTTFTFA